MPDVDMFSLLEIRKRESRSHGIRKKGNSKRKKRAVKRSNTSLKDLSKSSLSMAHRSFGWFCHAAAKYYYELLSES